jgi:hypothetical protein
VVAQVPLPAVNERAELHFPGLALVALVLDGGEGALALVPESSSWRPSGPAAMRVSFTCSELHRACSLAAAAIELACSRCRRGSQPPSRAHSRRPSVARHRLVKPPRPEPPSSSLAAAAVVELGQLDCRRLLQHSGSRREYESASPPSSASATSSSPGLPIHDSDREASTASLHHRRGRTNDARNGLRESRGKACGHRMTAARAPKHSHDAVVRPDHAPELRSYHDHDPLAVSRSLCRMLSSQIVRRSMAARQHFCDHAGELTSRWYVYPWCAPFFPFVSFPCPISFPLWTFFHLSSRDSIPDCPYTGSTRSITGGMHSTRRPKEIPHSPQ